jgi:hypothetical protein
MLKSVIKYFINLLITTVNYINRINRCYRISQLIEYNLSTVATSGATEERAYIQSGEMLDKIDLFDNTLNKT